MTARWIEDEDGSGAFVDGKGKIMDAMPTRSEIEAVDRILTAAGSSLRHYEKYTQAKIVDAFRAVNSLPDYERLLEAARRAYVELAALIPNPYAASVEDWPCSNAADRACLQLAYIIIQDQLQIFEERENA